MTGKRIRKLRKAKGLTGEELAKKAGISKGYVSQLETGVHQKTSADILLKIAKVLDTTIYDLMEEGMWTDRWNPEMPPSLQEMIDNSGERLDIQEEDIQILKKINYRGRQPQLPEDWEYLFDTIKMVIRPVPQ